MADTRQAKARRIGVLGGTFDPIHVGHLMLAEQMVGSLGLSFMLFVPSSRPPHKDEASVTPAAERVQMIRLAIEGNPRFELSTIECDDPGMSYTYKTFETLRGRYGPDAELFYAVGSDVLDGLDKFMRFERLFELCRIAVAMRGGMACEEASALARGLEARHGAKILLMPSFARIDVSSTDLRRRVACGESVRYMAPPAVAAYIESRRLYSCGAQAGARAGAGRRQMGMEGIADALRAEMSPKRFEHSMRVMETAERLARLHGLDAGKAAAAGLLHDSARDIGVGGLLEACERAGIAVSQIERRQPELLHGLVAAEAARSRFGVEDAETLDAIRSHTLGRPGMSRLEMALFVADAAEPGRRHEGADAARALADVDLEGAALAALDSKIAYVVSTGRMLHPATVHTRNWLLGMAKELI